MTDHTDTACTEPRGPMGPALAKALLSARGEFPAVTKSKTARIRTKTGGEYSYTYADLPAMLETYLPVLSRHGILLVYGAEPAGGGAAHLSATLIHVESGDSYTATLPLPADDDPKVQGARLTYLRRYLTNIV
ncbi:MAG: ERF family protein, partial [Gemmatimonadota bacterium]|nr:ERF family protein [Gemmatimonadota bacterium]